MSYNLECYLLFIYMMLLDVVDYSVKYLRFKHGGDFLWTYLPPYLSIWCRLHPPFFVFFSCFSFFFFVWDDKPHPKNTLFWFNSTLTCYGLSFNLGRVQICGVALGQPYVDINLAQSICSFLLVGTPLPYHGRVLVSGQWCLISGDSLVGRASDWRSEGRMFDPCSPRASLGRMLDLACII